MAPGKDKDTQRHDPRAARLKKALRANLARRKAADTGSSEDDAMKRREAALRKPAAEPGKTMGDD